MSGHADLSQLLAYWLGELDEPAEAELEQHYLGCSECSARLAETEGLADGVRRAFAGGLVHSVVTPAFADRLHAQGLRVREYRVPANGSVNCTVAPEDQVLLSRLEAPLRDVKRLDVIVDYAGGVRFEDVPFDAASGEVVVVPGVESVKRMPAHRQVMRLVAVDEASERVLGTYTFNHTPAFHPRPE
ncbi:MAG TPA: hypothetical protein VEC19_07630 [Usitatibacter sp.]|nr:hypothetical protein [Usitatibacter sp.]